MLNNFTLTVAFRYFRAKKNEKFVSIISSFSLLGVTIGVAALIIVMSVMNGFHHQLVKNIIGLNGDIVISSKEGIIHNYDEIKNILLRENGITYVIPNVTGQALALGPRTNSGVLIKGTAAGDLNHKKQIINNVIYGTFSDFHGNNVIAVGTELAYNLGVKVGSKLKLISPNTISTAFGSMPRSKEFLVIAVFNSGMYDYDAATILMPLEAASNFLSFKEAVNFIELGIANHMEVQELSAKIRNLLGSGFTVLNWQESNYQFLNALTVERTVMFTILSLIILVAAFNILSSLFMLVKDKTIDIAILKTIGCSIKQIMLIFICNGLFIGLIGTTLGVILGASFACNIESIRRHLEKIIGVKLFEPINYFLYTLPSEVQIQDVLLVASLSIFLCFISTIYPAYKASKLNPVDALRYE